MPQLTGADAKWIRSENLIISEFSHRRVHVDARSVPRALIAGFYQFHDLETILGRDGHGGFAVERVHEEAIFFDITPFFMHAGQRKIVSSCPGFQTIRERSEEHTSELQSHLN